MTNDQPPVPPTARVPTWATAHFQATIDAHENLRKLIHISEKGIAVLRGMPKIVKVLASVEGSSEDPKSKRRLETAEQEAIFAQTELERDFPVLHGLAVMSLWGELEHFTKGLVALWLTNRRSALAAPELQKLKVRFGDYIHLSKLEQARYLVDLLEQDLASSFKRGASRFESLLQPFDLHGSPSDGCRKSLFELQQVRNVMAHRNGKADRKFKIECPWLKTKINQPVLITRSMLSQYYQAALEYSIGVFYRVGDAYGKNLRPDDAPNNVLQPTSHASGVAGG